jgi:hypothetical protein
MDRWGSDLCPPHSPNLRHFMMCRYIKDFRKVKCKFWEKVHCLIFLHYLKILYQVALFNYSKLRTLISIVALPTITSVLRQWVQLWNSLLHSNLTILKSCALWAHWLSTCLFTLTICIIVVIMSSGVIIAIPYINHAPMLCQVILVS